MSEEKYKTSFTSVGGSCGKPFSMEDVLKVQAELNGKRFAMFSGLPVVEDDTGMWTTPNSFVVVMGKRMYAELKAHLAKNEVTNPSE